MHEPTDPSDGPDDSNTPASTDLDNVRSRLPVTKTNDTDVNAYPTLSGTLILAESSDADEEAWLAGDPVEVLQ